MLIFSFFWIITKNIFFSYTSTSKWVKDLSNASVYVDSVNGSDSNSGLSAAESVKTINEGIRKSRSILVGSNYHAYIKVAAGSYTETVRIEEFNIAIELLGDVTLTGNFVFYDHANIYLFGSFNFTVTKTVTGTLTGNGKRYICNNGGNIWVGGKGENRIPGANSGSPDTTSYGYYG